jgi:GDP/UDP-N,N'-diacetylbacillosamine 2-epimerase (hydrolysing)
LKVKVLTSTRADYSIYKPLLEVLESDDYFDLSLVVFGTHSLKKFGKTINAIKKDGYTISHVLDNELVEDTPTALVKDMARTMKAFGKIWKDIQKNDLIICLGDRYEMFAAVSASIPFNIPIAHFHGGETTLGAIDEVFRHSLTSMSTYHFTSAEEHSKRVAEIKGSNANIQNVGLMSISSLDELQLLNPEEFSQHWNIDLSIPTILFTFHPETINRSSNIIYVKELTQAIVNISNEYQVLITLPNADTDNQIFREAFLGLATSNSKVFATESLGMVGYFSEIKHSKLMLGNTSSGILEAASFNKYVINLGDRQKGRARSMNIIDCIIDHKSIVLAVDKVKEMGDYEGGNVFYQPNGLDKVVQTLKAI